MKAIETIILTKGANEVLVEPGSAADKAWRERGFSEVEPKAEPKAAEPEATPKADEPEATPRAAEPKPANPPKKRGRPPKKRG